MARDSKPTATLQTLDRGLALLEWVASQQGDAYVRTASEALQLNISTCYHLVSTLETRGYLLRQKGGLLRIGPAVSALKTAAYHQARPELVLGSVAEDLMRTTRETAYLTIWDGDDVMMLFSAEGPQHLKVSGLAPGFRGFANCRSTGKAVMAFLKDSGVELYLATHHLVGRTPNSLMDSKALWEDLAETYERGIAYDREEFEIGIFGIGAPFFDRSGVAVGAVDVSLPAHRFGPSREAIANAVTQAGELASRLLGYGGPYPPRDPWRAGARLAAAGTGSGSDAAKPILGVAR